MLRIRLIPSHKTVAEPGNPSTCCLQSCSLSFLFQQRHIRRGGRADLVRFLAHKLISHGQMVTKEP